MIRAAVNSQSVLENPHSTEATVKTHLIRSFRKLGVNDRTAAVTSAIALGAIAAPGQ